MPSALIARWYVWPAVRDAAPRQALTPLLLYASFRVNGLMFLIPGLVSTHLPKAFAISTAYGDLTAAVLALLALWPIRAEKSAAMPLVWLFNIVGLLDLIYANISIFRNHVDPTYLGVSYYLAAINVPAMVVVHLVIFAYLVKHRGGAKQLMANTRKVSSSSCVNRMVWTTCPMPWSCL